MVACGRQITEEKSIITENKIEVNYDLLKEVIPGNNKNEKRINMIFDCREMNNQQFKTCINNLKYYLESEEEYNNGGIYKDKSKMFYGLFQIEPYKSNKQQFNFWYINRRLLDEKTSENTMKMCDIRDDTITYNTKINSVIPVHVCAGSDGGHGTTIPIVKPKENINEKYDATESLKKQGENVIAFVKFGVNKANEEEFKIRIATFVHETGHATGGLLDEYITDSKGALKPINNGFPNCAANKRTADKWWKETELINPEKEYVMGCLNNEYYITDKDNMMVMSGKLGRQADELFTRVHRYWICRNIYQWVKNIQGICKGYEKYGFDKLLYEPI